MKRLKKGIFACMFLLVLIMGGISSAQVWDDTIYHNKITFASVAVNNNTADLGEINMGTGLVFWYTVEASASTDYDVHFFTQDDATWAAGAACCKDNIEQVYVAEGITTSYYADSTMFPFVNTDGTNRLYVGIYNDDDANASTFEIVVYTKQRVGSVQPTDTN